MTALHRLVGAHLGDAEADRLFDRVEIDPALQRPPAATVPRAELAQALTLLLFHDLVQRVPSARAHLDDLARENRRLVFDHGALRTVKAACGRLPPGEAAFARVLRPLGWRVAGEYPLPRLRMTGRAWCHADHPETIAQFFVSELHPERFSPEFQLAVSRVIGGSRDPLEPQDLALLQDLARDAALPWPAALRLLPRLAACFDRHHGLFDLADYQRLRAESAEMAWIATEGNAFNHATDRVADLQAVVAAERAAGRDVKDTIEVSRSGRVKQTAYRAAPVRRAFIDGDRVVWQAVPGSFYEFIERGVHTGADGRQRLDLAFDAANATGIFAMTG
ncbi:2-oxoadipate dioxygenase/decarboxylase family protein [Aquabacterium sp. J223]|uniref:2-oxoadipate dioxygenase/decarboxylase family protein n=1 Tax=Aquabacterium sp. J223 TaxID=2898431 RepID=UPI0021AE0469|nr:DUF1338 family protein [Aquabacterium sp. J223]UUX97241.1 DUF1338 family protein [Aquabacterium sp. J223]